MELPDLSHLTKEEQATILKVIQRQQDEEAKEEAMMKTLQEQFENYKVQVKKAETAALELKQSPEEIKDLCALCRKTKIAQGCGHSCSYCSATFCSRCGGRVVVRSDKNERMVTWVCTLCRKQHELLKKTGAWYRTEQNRSNFSLKLEPIPRNDAGKLTGSVSLAQLETNSHFKNKSQAGYAGKLRKGSSEPQLANCEKSPDVVSNQTQPKKIIDSSSSSMSNEMTGSQSTKDFHPTSSSSNHDSRESAPLPEKLVRQEKTSMDEKHKFPSNIEKNGEVATSVKKKTKSTVESHPSHKVPKEILTSNHFGNLKHERSKSSAPTFNGGANGATPYNQLCQKGKPDSLSIPQNVQDRRASSTPVDTDDYQSNLSLKARKFVDEACLQSRSARNSATTHASSSLGDSALSTASSVGNVTNGPRKTRPDAQESTYTRNKYQHRTNTSPNPKRPTSDQNMTELDSKAHLDNVRDHPPPHSPRSNRSSPRLLQSPVVAQRHCRRHSPMLSHKELHDALTHHKYHDERYTHRQEHHRAHSPARREIRQCTRHAARSKDCLSDNDGVEYSHHSHQPVRRHHRSSSSCLDEGRGHVELTCCDKTGNSHPSMIAFDDVSSHSCSTPCRQEHCRHCCNSASGKYHSDLNLPRSSCTYSSEGAVSSGGRVSHGVNCSQNKRSNSKHGSDYQLQMSHFRKHQRQKSRTGKHVRRKPSLSSTDDEIQSTPDYSSCEESERKIGTGIYKGRNPAMFISTESGYYSSHVNQNNDKTQPASWQPSSDGACLVGRMVLNKSGNNFAKGSVKEPSGGVLGVKVVGGKANEAGELGAYVSMVKKGSVADTAGHLKKGDEVIMWNNHCLRGASYEDVCKAILDSKSHTTVSLVVCRPIQNMPRVPETRRRHPATESSSSSFESQKRDDEAIVATRSAAELQSSPRFIDETSLRHRHEIISGNVQVSMWYDQATQQLYVSILQAVELPYRPGGFTRNPYIKMYLLPDRSEFSRRRTKTVKKSVNPVWNQSFSYGGLRKQDLGSMSLELTLWDLDRSVEVNGQFLGEVLIDLGLARIDDVPQWYKLMAPGEGMNQAFDQSAMAQLFPDSHCSHAKVGHGNHQQTTSSRGDYQERYALGRHHRETVSEANFSALTGGQHPHKTVKKPMHSGSLPSSSHYLSHDGCFTPPRPRVKHGSYGNNSPIKSNHSPSCQRGLERPSHSDSAQGQLNLASGEDNYRVLPNLEHMRQNTSTNQSTHNSDPLPNSFIAYDQTRNIMSSDSSLIDSRASTSAMGERTRRLSVDNVDSGNASSKVADDTLSKSVSLNANLHAPSKLKSLGSKSASSSNQTSPHSKNSSPSSRKNNNNFFAQKLLVGLKNRSQSSSTLESNRQKTTSSSTRCSEFGVHPTLQKDGSRGSASGSVQSLASEGSGRSVDRTLKDFVGGLGVGQVAGRQTLAASTLGKIQLAISDTGAGLEVVVKRAEGLVLKPGAKAPPAIHVKVYLMFEKQCIAKRKTKTALKSRNPEFRQSVRFEPNQYGNSLQVVVWGDYGRLDSKSFMGMAQIKILSSDQQSKQEGWYTLFPTSSILEISLLDDMSGSKTSLENHASGFQG